MCCCQATIAFAEKNGIFVVFVAISTVPRSEICPATGVIRTYSPVCRQTGILVSFIMSGHNKWSQIKNKKGAVDAKKSREFGKLSRLITVEVKKADGNATSPGVRQAVERARGINMPNENIERAIARGKEKDATALEEVVYEAYGPGGAALIILGLTDNKNRTGAEIKHLLSLSGAALAAHGAASWAFSREGNTWVPQNTLPVSEDDAQKLRELVEKLEEDEDIQEVFTNVDLKG